jgi:hypothetical protein
MSRQEGWMRRAEFLIVAAIVVLLALGWLYSKLPAS